MEANEKTLRAAMAERTRIAGVLAAKRTEFEAANVALKQRRVDHGRLAAGNALGESNDIAKSQAALDKSMAFVTDLGAVFDGIEERLARANDALIAAAEQFREHLRVEDSKLAAEVKEEFRQLVQNTFRPGLLRILAKAANRDVGISYQTLVDITIPGLSGERDLLQLQTSKIEPGTMNVRGCYPFEDDLQLMAIANQENSGANLLREAEREVAKFKKPDMSDGSSKHFAVMGTGRAA